MALLSAFAAVLIIPSPGSSGHRASPECTGDVPSTCSQTFSLNLSLQSMRVSVDHAHFHEFLSDGNIADGTITIEWRDAANSAVARWTCLATTAGSGSVGPFCKVESLQPWFSSGTQTMVVSAQTFASLCSGSCTFHARLNFH